MKTIVLDIGDVLVSLDRPARERGIFDFQMSNGMQLISYRDLPKDWLRDYSTGRINTDEYVKRLAKAFGVPASTVINAEEKMLVAPNAELINFFRGLQTKCQIVCLSNNQPLHWAKIQRLFDTSLFKRTFLSHDTGRLKPEARSYEFLTSAMSLSIKDLIFVDDELDKIAGAQAAGWINTHHHSSNEETMKRVEEWL